MLCKVASKILTRFFYFYCAKQDNGCKVDEASNSHVANMVKVSSFVLSVRVCFVHACTLFPENSRGGS